MCVYSPLANRTRAFLNCISTHSSDLTLNFVSSSPLYSSPTHIQFKIILKYITSSVCIYIFFYCMRESALSARFALILTFHFYHRIFFIFYFQLFFFFITHAFIHFTSVREYIFLGFFSIEWETKGKINEIVLVYRNHNVFQKMFILYSKSIL